jgi:N-acetyl-gamma-glutamyl-phosphate reductase
MSKKITVSIIGSTGYTGLELIRLLIAHPNVEIKHLTSHSHAGKAISSVWPHLSGLCDLMLTKTDPAQVAEESDVVFLALPHFQSSLIVPDLLGKTKIIDLSGDFRLKNSNDFKTYYKQDHTFPEGLNDFTYGLPEGNKEAISHANNIANPGCFATTCQLALLPFASLIDTAHILAVTGSSGSGKSPSDGTHHPIRSHNMKSYKIGVHQHLPEIAQSLKIPIESLTFVPTSGPFSRGIHATAFLSLKSPITDESALELIEKTYASSPFVRVKNQIQLADVVGSNYADFSFTLVNGQPVIQVVIDNLVKGAAGTALHNMNLMFGLDETTGLNQLSPLFP